MTEHFRRWHFQRRRNRNVRLTPLVVGGKSLACTAIAIASMSSFVTALADDPPLPVELQPYRVQVSVSFSANPLLDARFRSTVQAELGEFLELAYGRMWVAAGGSDRLVSENVDFPYSDEVTLQRLDESSLADAAGKAGADKLFLLSVVLTGGHYELAVREWDGYSEQPGPLMRRISYTRANVAHELALLIQDAFCPVATIEDADNGRVRARVHAAELASRHASDGPLQTDDLLRPVIRYFDRDHVLQRIEFLPWTYLQVETTGRSLATCRLSSGLRSPLGSARRRVEVLAILSRPIASATRLQLVTGNTSPTPEVGVEISVEREKGAEADEEQPAEPPQRLVTDRWGHVSIPAEGPQHLVWVSVHSGTMRLARVPLLPGHLPETTLVLPDDSERLHVEGQLSEVQTELIQTVARRGILSYQVRLFGKQGKLTEARQAFQTLESLPTADSYLDRIKAIGYTAAELARKKGNRIGALRIEKLCKSTAELVATYLDDTKIEDLRNELAELAQIQEDEK